jgi:hypothetical protein
VYFDRTEVEGVSSLKLITVKLKIFADKNIGDKYFCGQKMTLLRKEQVHFPTTNIITAKIFIRKFFVDDGIKN